MVIHLCLPSISTKNSHFSIYSLCVLSCIVYIPNIKAIKNIESLAYEKCQNINNRLLFVKLKYIIFIITYKYK